MIRVGDLLEAANDPIKLGAIERNIEFIRLVRDEVMRYMSANQARMGKPKGQYLDIPTGISSYYGYVGREVTITTYKVMMDHLRTLVNYQILGLDDPMAIRQIDWFSGSGAWLNLNDYSEIDRMKRLGLPSRGQFSPTDRRGEKSFGYVSFTGTDATVTTVMGDQVSLLKNLKGISWSTHRSKPSVRLLGKTNATGRGRGPRTIAGSLIFAETEEDPLLPMYPSNVMPKDMEYINGHTQGHQTTLLPDQLPPFDLAIVWQNEYGAAKQMIIYGLEIIDYGAARDDKDMMEEDVYQWTAVDVDPPRKVKVGADGTVDTFGVTLPGYSAYWERRWLAAGGLGQHEDPFEMTSQYFETIDAKGQAPKKDDCSDDVINARVIVRPTPEPPKGYDFDIDIGSYDKPTPHTNPPSGDGPDDPRSPHNPPSGDDPDNPNNPPSGDGPDDPQSPHDPPSGAGPDKPQTPNNPTDPPSGAGPDDPQSPHDPPSGAGPDDPTDPYVPYKPNKPQKPYEPCVERIQPGGTYTDCEGNLRIDYTCKDSEGGYTHYSTVVSSGDVIVRGDRMSSIQAAKDSLSLKGMDRRCTGNALWDTGTNKCVDSLSEMSQKGKNFREGVLNRTKNTKNITHNPRNRTTTNTTANNNLPTDKTYEQPTIVNEGSGFSINFAGLVPE